MGQVTHQSALLRLLGCVYTVAFLRLAREADFLLGPEGVASALHSPQRLVELRRVPLLRLARVFCGEDWAGLRAWTAWLLGLRGPEGAEPSPAQLAEAWLHLGLLLGLLLGLALAATRRAHRLPTLLLLAATYHGFCVLGGELFATAGDTLLLECGLLAVFLVPRSGTGLRRERTDLLASAGLELLKLLYLRARLLEAHQRLRALQSDELALFDVPASYHTDPPGGVAAAWYPGWDTYAQRWASNAYFAALVALPALTGLCGLFGAGFQRLGSLLLLASHCLLDDLTDFRFFLHLFLVLALSPWLFPESPEPAPLPAPQAPKRPLRAACSLLLSAASVLLLAYLLVDFEAAAQRLVLAPRQDLQQLLLAWNSRAAVSAFVLGVHCCALLALLKSAVRLWRGEHYRGIKRPKLVLELASACVFVVVFASMFVQQLLLTLGHPQKAFYRESAVETLNRSLQDMYGRDCLGAWAPTNWPVAQKAGLGAPVYHFEAYLTRVNSDKPGIWREVNFRGKPGSLAKPVPALGLEGSRFTHLLARKALESHELPAPLLVALARFRRHRETFGGRFSLQLFTADLANYNIKSLDQVEVRLLRVKKSHYKRCRPGAAGRHWTRTEDASFPHLDIDPHSEPALQQALERALGSKPCFGPAGRPPGPLRALTKLLGLF